jgi:hypothetical protein
LGGIASRTRKVNSAVYTLAGTAECHKASTLHAPCSRPLLGASNSKEGVGTAGFTIHGSAWSHIGLRLLGPDPAARWQCHCRCTGMPCHVLAWYKPMPTVLDGLWIVGRWLQGTAVFWIELKRVQLCLNVTAGYSVVGLSQQCTVCVQCGGIVTAGYSVVGLSQQGTVWWGCPWLRASVLQSVVHCCHCTVQHNQV